MLSWFKRRETIAPEEIQDKHKSLNEIQTVEEMTEYVDRILLERDLVISRIPAGVRFYHVLNF
jgi:hypothetical protein